MKNEVAEFWNKYEGDFAGDVVAPEVVRMSHKYIGKSVLDVGAGSGALIKIIPNAIGLDLAPKSFKIIKGDISSMPFKDNSFSTVFATEVLEHLDDAILNNGLKEVYRVLKSSGYFIITVPYSEKLAQNTVFCLKCGEKFHRWGHLQTFNEKSASNILENNGFKVIRMRVLPLGAICRFGFLKYGLWFFKRIIHFGSMNLFIAAKKA